MKNKFINKFKNNLKEYLRDYLDKEPNSTYWKIIKEGQTLMVNDLNKHFKLGLPIKKE